MPSFKAEEQADLDLQVPCMSAALQKHQYAVNVSSGKVCKLLVAGCICGKLQDLGRASNCRSACAVKIMAVLNAIADGMICLLNGI